MEHYIKERSWKQILEFIKDVNRMYSKDEKRLNRGGMVYGANSGNFYRKSMVTQKYTQAI
ncbi:MAG: hypothetical protein ACR5KV_00730 [Wolbachia sp.]